MSIGKGEFQSALLGALLFVAKDEPMREIRIGEAAEFLPKRAGWVYEFLTASSGHFEIRNLARATSEFDLVIRLTEKGVADAQAILNSHREMPARTLTGFFAHLERQEKEVPASDRIVTFSDNQAAVESALEKLEAASRVISASNSLGPGEKEVLSNTLAQGMALFSKPSTYVAAISYLILQPLYDAYKSVIEEAAKPLILAAIEAVKALLL